MITGDEAVDRALCKAATRLSNALERTNIHETGLTPDGIPRQLSRCRCRALVQPFGAPHNVGVRLTCPTHGRRWVWDGVTFIPDLHWYGLDGLDEDLDDA